MADLKSIAKMQIGGPKYPDKKRINLYHREFKKSVIALQLAAFFVFLIFLHFLVVLGVKEPLLKAERAELSYQRMEKQLESIQRSNRIMDQVQEEYDHYGNAWQSEAEKKVPDRLQMFDVLSSRIFPQCSSISSVSISEDRMDISCVLPKGTVLSELIRQIEEENCVRYVTASLEATVQSAVQTSELALSKKAEADITVYFYAPGESGENE